MHRLGTALKKSTFSHYHTSPKKYNHQTFLKKWKPGKNRHRIAINRKTSPKTVIAEKPSTNMQGESIEDAVTSVESIGTGSSTEMSESHNGNHGKEESHSVQISTDHTISEDPRDEISANSEDINLETVSKENESDLSSLAPCDSAEAKPTLQENIETDDSVLQSSDIGEEHEAVIDEKCPTDINDVNMMPGQDVIKIEATAEDELIVIDEITPQKTPKENPKGDNVYQGSTRSNRSKNKSSQDQAAQDSVSSSNKCKDEDTGGKELASAKDESKPSSDEAGDSYKKADKASNKKHTKKQASLTSPEAKQSRTKSENEALSKSRFPLVVLGPIEDSEWKLWSSKKKPEKAVQSDSDGKQPEDVAKSSNEKESAPSTRTPRRKVAKRAFSPTESSSTPTFSQPSQSVVATPTSHKKAKNYCPESVVKPFTLGWMREVVHRASGKGIDIYYFTPEGTKLRSMPEVTKYLAEHKKCGLTIDNFTFTKDTIYRHPFEKERGARVRTADGVEISPIPATSVKTPVAQSASKSSAKATPKKTHSSASKAGKQSQESASKTVKQSQGSAGKAVKQSQESAGKAVKHSQESAGKAVKHSQESDSKTVKQSQESAKKAMKLSQEPASKAAKQSLEPSSKVAKQNQEPSSKAAKQSQEPSSKAAKQSQEPSSKAAKQSLEPASKAAKQSLEPASKAVKQESQLSAMPETKKAKVEASSTSGRGSRSQKSPPKVKLFPGLLRRPIKHKKSSAGDKSLLDTSQDTCTSTSEGKCLPPISMSPTESTPSPKRNVAKTTPAKSPVSETAVASDAKDNTVTKKDDVQLRQVSSTSTEKRARKIPRRLIEEKEKSPSKKKARIKYTEVKKATPLESI